MNMLYIIFDWYNQAVVDVQKSSEEYRYVNISTRHKQILHVHIMHIILSIDVITVYHTNTRPM